MGKIFYHLFTFLYPLGGKLLSPFNTKAKQWVNGRKDIFERLTAAFANNSSPIIWVHCASLGEFEQGRPLIERLKNAYPSYKILLTFFSPSGYEVQKNYPLADHVFYLPIDSKRNAKKFIEITDPSLIVFIKYEFWSYYLHEAKERNVPLLLVSGIFRKSQPFFQWYGNFHRKMLHCFTHFFVQDENSETLLRSININNVSISGDTRFDRVLEIASHFEPIAIIEEFCGHHKTIVAGSTWLEDDEELDHYANTHPDVRFIIAPHDVGEERLKECKQLYKNAMLFSEYESHRPTTVDRPATSDIEHDQSTVIDQNRSTVDGRRSTTINTLIIDNIGMLSRLYKYATVAYVGGAFGGDGVHNVLEAAVYEKPVVHGPVFEKYLEAVELLDAGGSFVVEDALQLEKALNELLFNNDIHAKAAIAAGEYVRSKTGATEQVMSFVQEKRLLTN